MIDFLIADKHTWHENYKRVDGDIMELVAVQKSRRTSRKGRTKYIFHRAGSQNIYYSRSRHGIYFMPIAYRPQNMTRYFDVFVRPPVTPKEKEWLELYDYELTKS